MVYRFGGPRRGSHLNQSAPANYGRSNTHFPVQQELDWVTSRANAQYLEAIAVDGVELHYWKKTSEGRFCTCQTRMGYKAENSYQDIGDSPPVKVRHATSILNAHNNPKMVVTDGPFKGTVIGELPDSESGNAYEPTTGEKEQDVFDYITESDDDGLLIDQDDFLNNPEAGVVFGGEKNPCGICFKTGHVGGYQLLQGSRIILESSGEYPMDLQGFEINDDARPFEFTSQKDPNKYVAWILELPKYFTKLCAGLVRNNLMISRDTVLEFKLLSGGTWTPLTPASIQQFNGTKTKLLIRVRPAERSTNGVCTFTHVELVFQTAPWIKGQMGSLEKTTNFAIFQGLQTRVTELVLPPTLPNVSNEDVLYDSKYGILWKINSVSDFMTSSRQIMGWTANAREIHPDEMTYLLKVTGVPYTELNYAGLERIQGQFLTSDDRY